MTGVFPFFSVILTTYNRHALLPDAVRSVLTQTYEDLELIIVDDGSTDNTNEIINQFTDKRIKFISQENKGAGSARNTGIKNSNGKFICFLDDDDLYLPDHLSSFYKTLSELEFPVCMARTFAEVHRKDVEFILQPITDRNGNHPIEYIMNNSLYLPNVCLSRKILEKHLFNEFIPLNIDYEMWLRILSEFPLIEIKKHTTQIFFRGNSLSSGSTVTHNNYIRVWKEIFKIKSISKFISSKTKSKILYERYLWLMMEQSKNKNFKKTFSSFLHILIIKPLFLFSKEPYSLLVKSV